MLVGSTYSHVGISPRFFVLKLTPLAECSWENRTCVVSSNLLYMCLSARHIQLLQVHCLGWPICCTILQTCSQCKLNSGPYWYVSIISQVHCPSATDAHYVGIACLELSVHSDLFCRRPLPRVCVCAWFWLRLDIACLETSVHNLCVLVLSCLCSWFDC